MDSDLTVLKDPEDALTTEQHDETTAKKGEDQERVSYVQEIKKSEISVKHDATITLPKPALIELTSQITAPTINIASGPSLTLSIPTGKSVTMDVNGKDTKTVDVSSMNQAYKNISDSKTVSSDNPDQPIVTLNTRIDDQSDASNIINIQSTVNNDPDNELKTDEKSNETNSSDKSPTVVDVSNQQSEIKVFMGDTNHQSNATENTCELHTVSNEAEESIALNIEGEPSQTKNVGDNQTNTESILPAVEDEEQETRNKISVTKYKEPILENELLVIGTLEPGFGGLLNVIPVDSTHVWVYNCLEVSLVDTNNEKEINYYIPETSIINLHLSHGNILLAEDDTGRSIFELHKENEGILFQTSPTASTRKTFGDVIEDETLHIKAYAFSHTEDYLIVIVTRKQPCCCFRKDVQYIQKYTINGKLLVSKKMKQGIRNMLFTHIAGMVVNYNDNICIAGCKDYGFSGTVAVFTKDFRHRFSVHKNQPISSITVDPWHNIIFSFYGGGMDIIKGDGRFLISLSTKFADNGTGKRISVDRKGEYAWICTENSDFKTNRVVIIAYSASLDNLNLPHSFREIC